MIKINLLPRKVTRKKMTVIRHVFLGMALLLVLLAALGYVWSIQQQKIKSLTASVADTEHKKQLLKNVNQDRDEQQKKIDELKRRIEAIATIEKGRTIPLHLMDELTTVLDESLPIWITNLNYNETKVQIDGSSFDNPAIARFVKKLEESQHYKNVDLLFSQKSVQNNREIFQFTITAEVEIPEPPAAQPADSQPQGR